mmetsp:Transcript_6843/g.14984  ORF Transcript_6843/g.14984 Transcript_6843/m.14984 type:complete len:218 (+) Transcript_6843:186-839(+)
MHHSRRQSALRPSPCPTTTKIPRPPPSPSHPVRPTSPSKSRITSNSSREYASIPPTCPCHITSHPIRRNNSQTIGTVARHPFERRSVSPRVPRLRNQRALPRKMLLPIRRICHRRCRAVCLRRCRVVCLRRCQVVSLRCTPRGLPGEIARRINGGTTWSTSMGVPTPLLSMMMVVVRVPVAAVAVTAFYYSNRGRNAVIDSSPDDVTVAWTIDVEPM